jgi:beta-glucosidase-like glycosyl hydrolase
MRDGTVKRALAWLAVAAMAHYSEAADVAHAGMCDDPVNAALPFCDKLRDLDARVDDLVARIPLTAVANIMVDNATAVSVPAPPLHLSAYAWWNEALHGVGMSPGVQFKDPTPYATSFPQVLSVSASFNRTLFYKLGQAISTEARYVTTPVNDRKLCD